jgi:hypothetical protein
MPELMEGHERLEVTSILPGNQVLTALLSDGFRQHGLTEAYVDGELIGNWTGSFALVGLDRLGDEKVRYWKANEWTWAYKVTSCASLPFGDEDEPA